MVNQTDWLAVDIGGANLKVADGRGFTDLQAFSLWREPQKLVDTLRSMLFAAPPADHLAITMTGELADCFATKREGVGKILDAVEEAADHRHLRIYRIDGSLVAMPVARRDPMLVASANWHALARFAGHFAPRGNGMLIDIGTTTTDVVALVNGDPQPEGLTDTERLICGELIYTGVVRSPLAAVARSLPYRGNNCPVASEFFATMHDAYITLGDMPEDPTNTRTADGRPANKSAAHDRLARMLCADRESFDQNDAAEAARTASKAQCEIIATAIDQVRRRLAQPIESVVISGRGEFLARRIVEKQIPGAQIFALSEKISEASSECAPAHALAVIAREANA